MSKIVPSKRPRPTSLIAEVSKTLPKPEVENIFIGPSDPALAKSGTGSTTDSGSDGPTESPTDGPTEPRTKRKYTKSIPPPPPMWTTLVRKEVRMRQDQALEITALRQILSRKRKSRTQTWTDNTLIRIAVDLLLTRASSLKGDTEDELRRSVGLKPLNQSADEELD